MKRRSSFSQHDQYTLEKKLILRASNSSNDTYTFSKSLSATKTTSKPNLDDDKDKKTKTRTTIIQNVFDTDATNTLAISLRQFLATSWFGLALDVISSITSLLSCVLYVLQSYDEDRIELLTTIELSFTIYFLYEYLLRWFISLNRLSFLLETNSMIDILTIAPTFVEFAFSNQFDESTGNFLGYFRIIRIARISRMMRIRRLVTYFNTDYHKALADFVIVLFAGLFIFSGLLMQVENIGRYELDQSILEFHDVIYFLVVTLTTVGYGDIAPIGLLGRMIISVFVLGWGYYLPKTTNTLITLSYQVSKYTVSKYLLNPYVRHVVFCGEVSYPVLKEYLHEFYHEDHVAYSSTLVEYHVVVLCDKLPSKQIEMLINLSCYSERVKYFHGNIVNTDDLHRIQIHLASSILLVAKKHANNIDEMDTKTTLRALAIKKFCVQNGCPNVCLSLQILDSSNRDQYSLTVASIDTTPTVADQTSKEALCINDIRMRALAKSATCSLLPTFLSNLLVSVSDNEIEAKTEKNLPWFEDYARGIGYEIYFTRLAPSLAGLEFSKVVEAVYDTLEILLIGLVIDEKVELNLGNKDIPNVHSQKVKGIVIATDAKEADLSSFDVTEFGGDSDGIAFDTSSAQLRVSKLLNFNKTTKKVDPIYQMRKERDPKYIVLAQKVAHLQQQRMKRNSNMQEPRVENSIIETTLSTSKIGLQVKLKPPTSLPRVRQSILETRTKLSQHIIATGDFKSLKMFIACVRDSTSCPILIIFPRNLRQNVESLTLFGNIFWLFGEAKDPDILNKASISLAKQVTVLSGNYSTDDSHFSDFEALTTFLVIKKFSQSINTLIELQNSEGLKTLQQISSNKNVKVSTDHLFSSQYVSCNVQVAGLCDRLLWQGFHNPHLVDLIRCLITDIKVTVDNFKQHLVLQPIPKEFTSMLASDLFHYYISVKKILLALFRQSSSSGVTQDYVITCPSSVLKLKSTDKALILNAI